jgi:hypothetical protein
MLEFAQHRLFSALAATGDHAHKVRGATSRDLQLQYCGNNLLSAEADSAPFLPFARGHHLQLAGLPAAIAGGIGSGRSGALAHRWPEDLRAPS